MERKTLRAAAPANVTAPTDGAGRWLATMSDEDLVERHGYGEEGAFEEIYSRFGSMVYNLCFRMSGRAEVAEDLTQETFLRIHRHLARFSGRSTLKTWIYRVTLNHCRSKLGRKRYPSVPLAEENEEGGVHLKDPARGPEEHTLAHDAARRVAAGLHRVKPKFREAVVLRDIEGLSYDEIAEVLGVRIGTVRSRIARGREQLRKALEKMPS
ncbi:MAG: sigma-70 family RNA polymerase sigma factor [Acidobacteriota bacterium]